MGTNVASRRSILGTAGLAGLAAVLDVPATNAADTEGAELLRVWLLILQAPADLKLSSIPVYVDGQRAWVHGYELAAMTEEERWQWVNDWLAAWPDGRALLLQEIARLTSA